MKKIFYRGILLNEYCKEQELVYTNVRNNIRYHERKKQEWNFEKIVDFVIENYISRREFNKTKKILMEVHNQEKINITKISRELNIDVPTIYRLTKLGIKKKEAIFIIWFLHDKEVQNKFSISKKRIMDLLKIIKEENFEEINDFMVLLTLYNLGYEKVNTFLYNKRCKSLKTIISKLVSFYKLDKSYIEDILHDLYFYEITLYPKLIANNLSQNMRYLNLRSKGKIITFIKLYKTRDLHLDTNIKENQTYYDVISYERSTYEI